MSYFAAVETDRLPLPSDPDFWVEMKRRATYGDQLEAQSAFFRIDPGGAGIRDVELATYLRVLTLRMIVGWNLTDESGAIVPVTAENLERLSAEDGAFLAAEAQARASAKGRDSADPFTRPSGTPLTSEASTLPPVLTPPA